MSKGFTCECGKYHMFNAYVFAHYADALVHVCDNCGRKHSVLFFDAQLIEEPGPKPRRKRGKL